MRIFVTGTRGIPDIPGGVEKHCQQLYPLISQLGHQVYLATRSPYVKSQAHFFKGIQLIHLYAPRQKSIEAIVHTFLAVINAKRINADIIHIHAIGPGLMVPFAKMMGLKVIVTNHGPDYDRQKWGWLAKKALLAGEYLSGRFSDRTIVISSVIQRIIEKRCRRPSDIIYNGVPLPVISKSTGFLDGLGVKRNKYIIAVARFVPEKGLDLLIRAFRKTHLTCKLIIAGDADHESDYSRSLKEMIDDDDRIIRTGYITGEDLNQLFSHAGLFVLPSFHEGLPIALLEALSYGLPVLVSDIPANQEIPLDEDRFFKCGDVTDMSKKLASLFSKGISPTEKQRYFQLIHDRYNWQKIAEQTVNVYQKALHKGHSE